MSPGSAAACGPLTSPIPIFPKKSATIFRKPGKGHNVVMSNDVFHDKDGKLYLIDRYEGLEILEPQI